MLTQATWDDATAVELASALQLPRVELYTEVDSTQDVAHALAEQGAPHGTLVLADAQRAGRGRMSRAWKSEPGAGVWCTMIARPTDRRALDVLSIRMGLAIAEALDALAQPSRVRVKWPNDLLLEDGKLGGILIEARWSGATLSWVAIGMGINVRAPDVPLAAGFPAGVDRRDVLAAVVKAAQAATSANGWFTPDEMSRYRSRDALMGRNIIEPGRGRVKGIAENGALRVDTGMGIQEYRAGTITYAEDA